MTLSRRASVFLLAFAVWSWVIWPTFMVNIWKDDRSFAADGPTGFFVVHAVLVATSLILGTIIGVIGGRGLRALTRPTTTRRPTHGNHP